MEWEDKPPRFSPRTQGSHEIPREVRDSLYQKV